MNHAAAMNEVEVATISELLQRMLLKFEHGHGEYEADGVFESKGALDVDPAHPQVFLLVGKWYKRPEELLQLMAEVFEASCQVAQSSVDASVTQLTLSRQWAVARAVRHWMEQFTEDFKSQLLVEAIAQLVELMHQCGTVEMAEYISLDVMPEQPWGHHHSLSTASHLHEYRRPSMGFDATSALDLAEILCLLDYKLFRHITVQEFCIYARKAKPTAETPRIEECIQLFNGVTVWVVCSILREFTMVKRADIIEKFIDTVQCLLQLHCYNTMLAVVGGLSHFSIRRLSQTWSRVDRGKREMLEHCANYFSSNLNYSAYRQAMAHITSGFRIPVLGIVLKDLVAIDTQTKDLVDPAQQTINMNKYRLLSTSLSAIRQAQLSPPKVSSDLDRIRIMRAAINQSSMDDDALEELSLAREPRQRDSSSAGTNLEADLPKFSEWAAGRQSTLEVETLTKHVKLMVDAVFDVYDTDHSGNITMDEFEAISSNFPFIECFSVLDQDNDGRISYEEMLSYFLSANSILRERFTHNFVEHTFIGTSACEHCKGMLKGIVKQGVRCKDCGICCHRHCKDYVVVDCSRRKEKKPKKSRSQNAVNPHSAELYCDDDISLKERLQRAEAARDALSVENAELQSRLAEANARIYQLQSHVAMIRQHTIGFILEQMNTLNPQMEPGTEV